MNVKALGLEELSKPATKKINGGVSIIRIYGLGDGIKGNTEWYIFGKRVGRK